MKSERDTWLTLRIDPKGEIDIGEDITLRFKWNSNGRQTKVSIRAPQEFTINRVKVDASNDVEEK